MSAKVKSMPSPWKHPVVLNTDDLNEPWQLEHFHFTSPVNSPLFFHVLAVLRGMFP